MSDYTRYRIEDQGKNSPKLVAVFTSELYGVTPPPLDAKTIQLRIEKLDARGIDAVTEKFALESLEEAEAQACLDGIKSDLGIA